MTEVICFPWERNVGKARRVATVYLRRRSDKDRTRYWSDTCGTIECIMRRRGFSHIEIARQIKGFKAAVEWEIEIIKFHRSERGPGTA